jgi:dTMP kinase
MNRGGEHPRGYFITVEGIEGVGKSTQCKHLADYLRGHGLSVVETREPGGTEVGERIRQLLLDRNHIRMASHTELLLLFAARAEHLDKVIKPALASGQWVVCDRFTDASYAYQGAGRGIPIPNIEILEKLVQGGLQPDLTLFLDAPAPIALARMANRGNMDRFETEKQAFFERVRAGYLRLAEQHPQRFRIIDATQSIADVTEQISVQLDSLLP